MQGVHTHLSVQPPQRVQSDHLRTPIRIPTRRRRTIPAAHQHIRIIGGRLEGVAVRARRTSRSALTLRTRRARLAALTLRPLRTSRPSRTGRTCSAHRTRHTLSPRHAVIPVTAGRTSRPR